MFEVGAVQKSLEVSFQTQILMFSLVTFDLSLSISVGRRDGKASCSWEIKMRTKACPNYATRIIML